MTVIAAGHRGSCDYYLRYKKEDYPDTLNDASNRNIIFDFKANKKYKVILYRLSLWFLIIGAIFMTHQVYKQSMIPNFIMYDFVRGFVVPILVIIMLLHIVSFLHEHIHKLFMDMYGGKCIIKRRKFNGVCCIETSGHLFTRNSYILSLLAPSLAMILSGFVLCFFFSHWFIVFFVLAYLSFDCWHCSSDIISARALFKYDNYGEVSMVVENVKSDDPFTGFVVYPRMFDENTDKLSIDDLLKEPRKTYGYYDFRLHSGIFESISKAYNIPLTRKCPMSSRVFNDYMRVIQSLSKQPEVFDIERTDQCFDAAYTICNLGSYRITWSISKALKIIERDKNKVLPLLLRQIKNFSIANETVDKTHLINPSKKKEPIILSPHESFGKLIIIDGNHRISSHGDISQDDNITTIDSYFLNYEQSLEAMQGDIDRTFYKIHTNIIFIFQYMIGNISYLLLQRILYDIPGASGLIFSNWIKKINRRERYLKDLPNYCAFEFIINHK